MLKRVEDHLPLNRELCIPRLGKKDGHCEAKTSLSESGCVPLSHLGKNTAAVHFTGWKNGYNKTCLFHRFLSAYISAVPLEPCLKSTVRYSTASWEIRQMYAMFRIGLSVK